MQLPYAHLYPFVCLLQQNNTLMQRLLRKRASLRMVAEMFTSRRRQVQRRRYCDHCVTTYVGVWVCMWVY